MFEIIKSGIFESVEVFKDIKKTPQREVQYYEAELYIEGNGQTVINGKSFDHQPGNLVFAKPGQLRYSIGSFRCYHIHFQGEHVPDGIADLMPAGVGSFYKDMFAELIQLAEGSDEVSQLLLQSKLYGLLGNLLNSSQMLLRATSSGVKIDPDLCQKAIHYMETNLNQSLQLSDLAAEINLSPIYFHKMFTAFSGRSPRSYLEQLRISKAKEQLLTTSLTLNEIAENCGFSSLSYFSFTFKKHTGITPGSYRSQRYISL